ncbi:MAG: two-component system, chemotaxis family, sensor kinase CheA [Acidobacteriota bacterium]|jgi:two-component system chemotaxis sensor kinase CheA|nr:two-component system, chemotaxis family, sensor kinase CheA [Acidobacteriota bacterium]
MDERLLREFLAEAEELIEELYGDVAELRERRSEGPARRELVARTFRHVHTVKGTAAAAGLDAAGRVAHEFESLLDAVRRGGAPLDEEVLDACEEAVGALAESLDAAARGAEWAEPARLFERLSRLTAHVPAVVRAAEELLPPEVARALSAYEQRNLAEAVAEGARAYLVSVDFDLSDFDEQYKRLSESLKESGEIVSTQPFVGDVGPGRVGFRIVYASAEALTKLTARASAFGATLDSAIADPVKYDSSSVEPGGKTFEESRDGTLETSEASEATPLATTAPASSSAATGVRVTLEELDELISATHGLFADTLGALDLALATGAEARTELEDKASAVRRRFFELEERLIGLRMAGLRVALLRAARAGRAAAREAGKHVEFEVAGGDARLDRSLAERVADPLLHLVRNAVDHGVETEGERLAAGKPAVGRVRVEADSEGGLVVLRVSDDGRGVDVEAVARAAAAAGLVAPGTTLDDAHALRLIFRPGFSTAGQASLVSGRGVGLDVVERAVEEAGGEVRVRSQRGRGTTFELRLPTTLALLPAHVVKSAGRRYCLDALHVVEAGHAEASDLIGQGVRRTLRWRGRELPLVELRELLGLGSQGDETNGAARRAYVVARARQGSEEEARAAIAVDELEGQSEVLVRGLGRHAKRWRAVGGATELRDGTVAIVLDLPRLLESLD